MRWSAECHRIPSAVGRLPAAPVNHYDALAEGIGLGVPQPVAVGYPGIRELARNLGLR
jgi:hypothetical protein